MAVLDSGYLVQGADVERFETAFADYHGAKHAVAVNNGTSALIAAMMAHGIKAGDEVIVPTFSFFATAASVLSVGAVPIFADIDPDTFCLSPSAAEAAITSRTVAIMPVHLYGHPAQMHKFAEICEKHGLFLLEDAAQAHGAKIGDRYIGTFGTASFSFYPSKNMTTGEGGMVLTQDDEIYRQLRMIRNQGMNQQYHHEVLGYNLRMTNIQAAIGNVQLESLPQWTQHRIDNASYFNQHLKGVKTPTTLDNYTHVFHQYTIRVPAAERDQLLKQLNERGIGARVYYPSPIHHQPAITCVRDFDLAESDKATKEVISLPVHSQLTAEERQYIVDVVNDLRQHSESSLAESADRM
ncbi:aminotransferase class I/II-fold pyridoxal phosphate-dependent enzyme [bacterium]|nr:aminotransferase class I/II-fold pyridoxal phosphate-dependent enzyme [bacterium]